MATNRNFLSRVSRLGMFLRLLILIGALLLVALPGWVASADGGEIQPPDDPATVVVAPDVTDETQPTETPDITDPANTDEDSTPVTVPDEPVTTTPSNATDPADASVDSTLPAASDLTDAIILPGNTGGLEVSSELSITHNLDVSLGNQRPSSSQIL